jgi:hypothetical protein
MRRVIKHDRIHVEGGGGPGPYAAPAAHGEAPRHAAGARVRALRLDGRVRAIEFTCSCGEVSLLELDYGPPADDGRAEEKS